MRFRIKIPDNANTIINTLQNNGHSAYVVGGCVRDSLMGRIPHDWDICTSATPEQMLEIFKDFRVIETGLKHGTVTIVIDGEQYAVGYNNATNEYDSSTHLIKMFLYKLMLD